MGVYIKRPSIFRGTSIVMPAIVVPPSDTYMRRPLKVQWTPELAADLRAFHGGKK